MATYNVSMHVIHLHITNFFVKIFFFLVDQGSNNQNRNKSMIKHVIFPLKRIEYVQKQGLE